MSDAPPLVLLLSGPSGSGKSATALAWADTRPVTTACVNLDNVRMFVRAGQADATTWGDDAERQWHIAIRQCAQMTRTYVDNAIGVVVDAYAPPLSSLDPWDDALDGLDVQRAYLLPGREVCVQRNAERGVAARLPSDALLRNYEDMEWSIIQANPRIVIDNGALSIAETVAALENRLV